MTWPAALLDQLRAATLLVPLIGATVRLKRNGRSWMGLCPFHGEKTPSFSVNEARGFFHCFGCGAHGDAFGWLMRRDGMNFVEAVRELAGQAGVALPGQSWERRAPAPPVETAPAPSPPPAPDDSMDRVEAARRIWVDASPIADGGVVAAYLARRHLWPPEPNARAVLRQAQLRHKDTGQRHPAMVARIDGPDGQPCGVHRTYLTDDGRKLPDVAAKLALGALRGGVIRLAREDDTLGVAEGIETALAVRRLHDVPCWACISTAGMRTMRPPFVVNHLVVFADRDAPSREAPEGPGMAAARALVARLGGLHVTSEIRLPRPPHGDYADVLAARETELVG